MVQMILAFGQLDFAPKTSAVWSSKGEDATFLSTESLVPEVISGVVLLSGWSDILSMLVRTLGVYVFFLRPQRVAFVAGAVATACSYSPENYGVCVCGVVGPTSH